MSWHRENQLPTLPGGRDGGTFALSPCPVVTRRAAVVHEGFQGVF